LPLDENERVARRGRRSPRGSNLFLDQSTIRGACRLTDVTGDLKYRDAADAYIGYYLDHFINSETGLIEWGWHTFYSCFDEMVVALEGHQHEIQGWLPEWATLYRVRPEVTRRELEQILKWHVDHRTGQVGRHHDRGRGCALTMAAAEFAGALAFLNRISGDPLYLEMALRVMNHHLATRKPGFDIVALDADLRVKGSWSGQNGTTTQTGCFCTRLLLGYGWTGCEEMRDTALAGLRAWARYGWDEAENVPWGMLTLEGKPVTGPRAPGPGRENYSRETPCGHLDLWHVYVLGWEWPASSAMAYLMAYDATGDSDMLETAKRWGDAYRRSMPPCDGKGTYAQHYGQVISLFVGLAGRTGDQAWLEPAKALADEAIDRLWTGRLFRGHPAKPYYEAVDGVGFLICGLIELHEAIAGQWNRERTPWNL
jgi:uncharacterized protein YyaL (SSP411 family)